MSRKHYEATAAVIKARVEHARATQQSYEPIVALAGVAQGLAAMFAADNARFDRGRFLTACGFGATA